MSIGSSPFQGGGSSSIADATESTAGKIRIATTSESNTGTNDVTAMTPAKVKARIDAALVGGIDYKGTFNATTGLTNSGGNLNNAEQGDLYVIDTAGTIYGATWAVGDHLLINADMGGSISNSKIDKVDNTDLVTSVNGQTGAVNIYADDSTLNIAGTGLSISGSGATSTLNADSASESAAGIIEIATNAEATAGSATDKALVPSNLSSVGTSQLNNDAGFITSVASASDSVAGIIEIATNAEATAGSATDKALVPSNLSSVGTSQLNNDAGFITSVASASDTTAGIIEIATNAEATSGSATDKALVPSNLSSVGTSQLNNDAGFITSAGVGNQITTVVRTGNSTSITAVVNALYSIGTNSATVTLPSSSLSQGDLVGIGAQGSDKTNTVVSGAISNSNNTDVTSVTFTASRRGVVWFAYDSDSSKWVQLNDPTNLSSATEAGLIEIATNAEATAGSATDKALVPSNLSSVGTSQLNNDAGFITSVASASDTTAGIIEIATNAEATAGSATDKALVPSNLSSVGTSQLNNDAGFITSVASASDTTAGIIEIATNAEATAGSATDKALVPSNLSSIGTSQLNNDAGFVTSSTAGGVTPTLTVRSGTSYTLTAANAKGVHVWYGGTTSSTFTLTLPAISDVISTATASNGDPEETFEVYVGRRVAGDITISAADKIDILGDGSSSYSATQTVRTGQWIKIVGWYSSSSTQRYFMSGSSQPYDAGLESISGLTTAADKMIYTTGSDTYAVTDLTTAGRALLDDADTAAQRTTLGLEIGSDVQAFNAQLTDVAGLTPSDGAFIVGDGSTFIAESGATARTSLGLTIGTDVLSDLVQDTTPQLGGDLNLNGQDIVTASNADLELAPDGTGAVTIKGNSTGGSGRLKFNCEQNSHGVTIKGPPHSALANYTLTLPNDDGTPDQILKTDGSGSLSWVDQASGGGGAVGKVKRVTSNYTIQLSELSTTTELYVLYDGTSGGFGPTLIDPSSLLNTNTAGGASTDTVVLYLGRTTAGRIFINANNTTIRYMNGGGSGYTNPNEFIKCVAYKDGTGSYWVVEETQAHLDYNYYAPTSSYTPLNFYIQDQHHSVDTSGGNITGQLPASTPLGGEWRFSNFRGNGTVTINTASSEKIYPANVTSITLSAGDTCLLIRGYNNTVGVGFWERMY